jgi:hypothetical protein
LRPWPSSWATATRAQLTRSLRWSPRCWPTTRGEAVDTPADWGPAD